MGALCARRSPLLSTDVNERDTRQSEQMPHVASASSQDTERVVAPKASLAQSTPKKIGVAAISSPKVARVSGEMMWKEVATTQSSCIQALQEEVEHALKQCTVHQLRKLRDKRVRDCNVQLDNFAVNGEANIANRTCNFTATILFSFEGFDAFGGNLGVTGVCEVTKFTHADSKPKITVQRSSGQSMQARNVIEWVKDEGLQIIAGYLSGPELSAAVASAVATGGGTTQPIGTDRQANAAPIQEHRDMSKWAEDWLMQQLSAMSVTLFGGIATATFSDVTVSGTASISTKRSPQATYSLILECTWSVVTSMAGAGSAEGVLVISSLISGVDPEKLDVHVSKAEGRKSAGQLVTAFKQQGIPAMRTTLGRFASELEAA